MNYIRKSFSVGISSMFISSLIILSLSPMILNQIGLEEYGVWAFYNSLLSLAALFDVGLSRSIVYFIAKATNEDRRRKVASTGFALTVIAASICILLIPVLYFAAEPNPVSDNISFMNFFHYLPLFISLAIMISFFRAILESCQKLHYNHLITSIFQSLNILAIYIISTDNQKLENLIITTLIVYLINIFAYAAFIFRIGMLCTPRLDVRLASRLFHNAKSYFILGIANALAVPINRFFVQFFLGSAAHALFDIALKFVMAWNSVIQILNAPLFTIFVEKRHYPKKIISLLLSKMIFLSVGMHVLGIISAIIFVEMFANYLLPDNTKQFTWTFLILFIGIPFSAAAEPIIRYLWSIGQEKVTAIIRLATLSVNILIFIILFHIGLEMSGPLAFSAAMTCSTVFYLWRWRDMIDASVIWGVLKFSKRY